MDVAGDRIIPGRRSLRHLNGGLVGSRVCYVTALRLSGVYTACTEADGDERIDDLPFEVCLA